ncbi:SsrA-binding protein [Flavobacterium sp.]|uniref:SsrA-binding protein n=1 Tax=Flavobacterium sp. TaxID=239 RepID=UPI002620B3AA|nr:SsrA-binding protein [Flavobacterium sp.]
MTTLFKIIARINKGILPSFTKQQLDPSKAKKWQLAVLAWRYYVTSRCINQ